MEAALDGAERRGGQDGCTLSPRTNRPVKLMTTGSAICVLVVEDEVLSRLHAVDLVEDAGYTAIEASNADEAIAILEARKDIRIVLTDIDMPGSMELSCRDATPSHTVTTVAWNLSSRRGFSTQRIGPCPSFRGLPTPAAVS